MTAAPVISLRAATPEDLGLLERIYATSRDYEMSLIPWDDDQKAVFLQMQFRAQHTDYHRNYPDASFDIIEQDGIPIGRLYVDRRRNEIHVLDITLLREFRGQGIGTDFFTALIAEAAAASQGISLYVEPFNPALRLYQRLAFQPVEETGAHLLMRLTP